MTDHEFQPGDLATWDAIPAETATVLSVTDTGVRLRYSDDDVTQLPQGHHLRAAACSPVPVTADHVGKWARAVDRQDPPRPVQGEVAGVSASTVRIRPPRDTWPSDVKDKQVYCDADTAILVAAPDDAPTPAAASDECVCDFPKTMPNFRCPYHGGADARRRPDPAPDTTGGSMRPMAPTGLGPAPCAAPDTAGQQDEPRWMTIHDPAAGTNHAMPIGAVSARTLEKWGVVVTPLVPAARAVADRAEAQRLRGEVERQNAEGGEARRVVMNVGRVLGEYIGQDPLDGDIWSPRNMQRVIGRAAMVRNERDASRALVTQVEDARDRAAVSARDLGAKLAQVQAERDAASAQGATSTDGLDEEDAADVEQALRCSRDLDSDQPCWPVVAGVLGAEVERLRDRLAREAQAPAPDDGGDGARAALGAVLADLTGERDPETLESWAGDVLAHVQAQTPAPDEDEATADLVTITDSVGVGDKTYALAWRRTRDRLDAGWRLVPPAPAPDEDTATVDEVAREVCPHLFDGRPWEHVGVGNQEACRGVARVALDAAAARRAPGAP